MEPKDRLIFAADVESSMELAGYLTDFRGEIGAVKLGMEVMTHQLLTRERIVDYVFEETKLRIMLDLKYGDIPATVAGAAKQVARYCRGRILGFTIHCSSGLKAMQYAVNAVKEICGEGPEAPLVIGVTLLTSLEAADLATLGVTGLTKDVVLRWAELAYVAGVPAIVCSPRETSDVLSINPNFTVINPGIRFAGSDLGTQKRVTTPGEAVANGASYIVMGSDLRKGEPLENARRAVAEIEQGLKARGIAS